MRKAKFRVGQWVAIRGFETNDPRQLGIVKTIRPDLTVLVRTVMDDEVSELVYTLGELRPLTQSEIGPRKRRKS